MRKVHERHRRLETRKKTQILTKEQRDLEIVKEVRGREDKLVSFRYQNRVSHNVSSDTFNKSLDDWSKKGFAQSLLDKSKQELLSQVESKVSGVAGNLYARRNQNNSMVIS